MPAFSEEIISDEELDALAGRINGDYGDLGWIPIRYLARSYPREELAGLYRLPLCFFIDNNLYAVSTTLEESTAETRLSSRGPAFGLPSFRVKGFYIAISTLALQFIAEWFFNNGEAAFVHGGAQQTMPASAGLVGPLLTVGGDNAIAACPLLDDDAYLAALDRAGERGVDLRAGVGTGDTPADAGMGAKHALERGRETGDRLVHA